MDPKMKHYKGTALFFQYLLYKCPIPLLYEKMLLNARKNNFKLFFKIVCLKKTVFNLAISIHAQYVHKEYFIRVHTGKFE